MVTKEDTKKVVPKLPFFHSVLSISAVVMLISALTVTFFLRNEIPANSPDSEQVTRTFKITVPLLVLNAILIVVMTFGVRHTSQVPQRSAMPLLEREVDVIKNTVSAMRSRVAEVTPVETEDPEELVEQLQLFSLEMKKTVKFALKTEEQIQLFIHENQLGRKKEAKHSFDPRSPGCRDGSGEAASKRTSEKEETETVPSCSGGRDRSVEAESEQISKFLEFGELVSRQGLDEMLFHRRIRARENVLKSMENRMLENRLNDKGGRDENKVILKEAGAQTLDAESSAAVPIDKYKIFIDSCESPEIKDQTELSLETSEELNVVCGTETKTTVDGSDEVIDEASTSEVVD